MIRHLLGFEIRRLLRVRAVFLLWLAFPIVLASIEYAAFGGLGSSRIPTAGLAIVDRDSSFVSRFVPGMFEREPLSKFFTVEKLDDPARIRDRFQSAGDAPAAALVIPEGFGDSLLAGASTTLELVRNPLQSYGPEVSEAVLTTLLEMGNRMLAAAREPLRDIAGLRRGGGAAAQDSVSERDAVQGISGKFYDAGRQLQRFAMMRDFSIAIERPESAAPGKASSSEFFGYFFPGLLLFSLLFLAENVETRFMRDRIAGLARRTAVTPVSAAGIVTAEVALGLITTLFASAVVLLFGFAVFEISTRDPLGVALVLLGYSLFGIGLIKFIFAAAKSARAAGTLGSVVILMLSLFGGAFAPIEIYPAGIAAISRWTPLGAGNIALVGLLAKGQTTASVAAQAALVWAWAALFLALGLARRWRLHGR